MGNLGDGTSRSVLFGSADLPRLFHYADQAAIGKQRRTIEWVRQQLTLLVLAAACSALPWRLRAGHVDLLALLSACAYLGALWFTWQTARHHPKADWQLHRSAAEMLRSQCWRYAVCGAPFEADVPDPDTDFELSVYESLQRLRTVGWDDPRPAGSFVRERRLITPTMRAMRDEPLIVRRDVYVRDRVMEQRAWYQRRAAESRRASAVWQSLAVVATAAALAAAGAKAFEWGTSLDLVGLASAVAASIVAWSELRQYQPLVSAHSLVAQELSTMEVTMEGIVSERLWASWVQAAEDAISPEHTAWLARHRV